MVNFDQMDAFEPAFVIREARPGDHRQLLDLARELDSINLPTDSRGLRSGPHHAAAGRGVDDHRQTWHACSAALLSRNG
jgi:hypothetical protein